MAGVPLDDNAAVAPPAEPASDRWAYRLFLFSLAAGIFCYGVAVGKLEIFPYEILLQAKWGGEYVFRLKEKSWPYRRLEDLSTPRIRGTSQASRGLFLVTRLAVDREFVIELMDAEGEAIHRWHADWFAIWPDADHIPEQLVPKWRPGTIVHGAVVLETGDVIFNFEHLGLVCLDWDGVARWRLPYQTHHSVHRHNDGNLWVCGEKWHSESDPRFPNHVPPFIEQTLLEISTDGKILDEWSVPDILTKNGYRGLLHLDLPNTYELQNFGSQEVQGDQLHLNGVEPFPDQIQPGFFGQGDILVSLRNINTVFVFERDTENIKFITTGAFVRQHDPSFVDGNTISVFDNNHNGDVDPQSRIVLISLPENKIAKYYAGTPEAPFYSPIMGKMQWLPDGHLLVTDSSSGRAFELNRERRIVWEFHNLVGDGTVGLVTEVSRLTERLDQKLRSLAERDNRPSIVNGALSVAGSDEGPAHRPFRDRAN
jgi:hypothetical protein